MICIKLSANNTPSGAPTYLHSEHSLNYCPVHFNPLGLRSALFLAITVSESAELLRRLLGVNPLLSQTLCSGQGLGQGQFISDNVVTTVAVGQQQHLSPLHHTPGLHPAGSSSSSSLSSMAQSSSSPLPLTNLLARMQLLTEPASLPTTEQSSPQPTTTPTSSSTPLLYPSTSPYPFPAFPEMLLALLEIHCPPPPDVPHYPHHPHPLAPLVRQPFLVYDVITCCLLGLAQGMSFDCSYICS